MVMIDVATLVLVYLIGSSVNTTLTIILMEREIEKYREGWDYIHLIATFLFWPILSILRLIAMPFWSYKGFKHPINRDHNG